MSKIVPTHPATEEQANAKIARYRWADVSDSPGLLEYVPIGDLSVDHTYQRDLSPGKKRLRMAAQFSRVACGCLVVGRRSDGSLVILDGQHRHAAALSRGDIASLPCIIFDLASTTDEAGAFLISNKERQPLKTFETFKAMLETGDPSALKLSAMFAACGRTPGRGDSGRSVDCVGACLSAMKTRQAAFLSVWPILTQLCLGSRLDSRLVTGLTQLEQRLQDQSGKRSVTERVLRDRLIAAGYPQCLRYISDACAFYHRGGDSVFAKGLLNLLNFKARIRLSLRGDSD